MTYRHWPDLYPGRRAIGYLCSYVPEEIIHAAGFTPIRIFPGNGPAPRADAHLQSYTCSLARGCLEQALAGELDFLEGVVFPHTCDTIQCLTDIWLETAGSNRANKHVWIGWVIQPVTMTSPHALTYLVAELKRFAHDLCRHFGLSINEDALSASITLYNRNRRFLAAALAQDSHISAVERWNLAKAAMLMPPEEFPVATASWKPSLVPRGETDRPGLILSGSTLDDPALLSLIEELGGRVVGDDLCNGERYFDTPVPEDGDPWENLAWRYLHRIPCPCKHYGLDAREKHLLGLVKGRGAAGVIFTLKKFCEPHAWDYPYLAKALDREGIPHLLLEMEATTPLGALRTRLEAFLEMIGAAYAY